MTKTDIGLSDYILAMTRNRNVAKKEKNDVASMLYKLGANSSYGKYLEKTHTIEHKFTKKKTPLELVENKLYEKISIKYKIEDLVKG